jgi:phospholipid/cholesterol/gamma-HCH transport system substrate-binding protein
MITGTDNRFKQLEKKVGIFIIAALVGVLAVVLIISVENGLFRSTYGIRLTSPKGTGISQGMPIKLSGFRIGRVKSITLNDTAAVDVVLQIDKKYSKWIRKDSVAKLLKEGFIGDYIIEISGGTSAELIPENGEIALEKTKALDELAEEIAEKVKPVLMDIRDIITYVNASDGDIKQTLRNLNTFTGNLETSREKTDRLLTGSRQMLEGAFNKFDVILVKAESRVDQVAPLLEKVDSSLGQIDQRLPVLLGKVEKSLSNLETLSGELRNTTSESVPKIPGLIDSTKGVIDESGAMIEGMKSVWPISSAIEKPEERPLVKGDSHE